MSLYLKKTRLKLKIEIKIKISFVFSLLIINKFWDRKGFREKKSKNPANGVKIRDFITDNGDDNDSTVKNNNSVRASHFLVHFLAVLCEQTTRKFQLRRCC